MSRGQAKMRKDLHGHRNKDSANANLESSKHAGVAGVLTVMA